VKFVALRLGKMSIRCEYWPPVYWWIAKYQAIIDETAMVDYLNYPVFMDGSLVAIR
jgi:hypothetical protein